MPVLLFFNKITVLCHPIAMHCLPPARLALSTPPPLVVFSATHLPCVVYLLLSLCYPLPASPPTYSNSIRLLHSSSSLCPCHLVIYCRGHWMPPPPWNAPAHHYRQTSSSSVTATALPVVRCHCQTLPGATAIKRNLCHHSPLPSCLHLSPPPPFLLSTSAVRTAAHHCHPLPQLSNAIFSATAALCHLPSPRPLNTFKCHHPIWTSLLTTDGEA